ncbi:MAG: DMT family transporter [Zoogloeaceae bacterium]|jgi:hypothetical protein|nr:DMT family transporter [Zoogloeaceae bacterium]
MIHHDAAEERLGVFLAFFAAFGFSLKAIFVKLIYLWPVGAVTLLALRMLFSLPAFAWVGWKSGRAAPALSGKERSLLVVLGMLGYYGSSLLDFMGLQYISSGLERLILFTCPTFFIITTSSAIPRAIRTKPAAPNLAQPGLAKSPARQPDDSGDPEPRGERRQRQQLSCRCGFVHLREKPG